MRKVRAKGFCLLSAAFLWFTVFMPTAAQQTSDHQFHMVAVNFPRDVAVKLKLRGTTRYAQVNGSAEIKHKGGYTEVRLSLKDVVTPGEKQYTTYVVWAVTPEGLTDNLGELRPQKNPYVNLWLLDKIPQPRRWEGMLETATRFRTFGLVVTAEPHFLVQSPSRQVIAANMAPEEKFAGLETESFKLDFRGDVGLESVPWREDRVVAPHDIPMPMELIQARRALDMALFWQVGTMAPQELKQAEQKLSEAEQEYQRGQTERAALLARAAIRQAERARQLNQERLDAQIRRRYELDLADALDKLDQVERGNESVKKQMLELQKQLATREREWQHLKTFYDDEVDRLQRQLERARQEVEQMRARSIPIEAHNFMMNLARLGEFRYEGAAFVLTLAQEDLFAAQIDERVAVLSDAGQAKLNRVAQAMMEYPEVVCRIQSRVGDQGRGSSLHRQAELWTTTVTAYLMSKGIATDRLATSSVSAQRPPDRVAAGLGRIELVFSRKAPGTASTGSTVETTRQTQR